MATHKSDPISFSLGQDDCTVYSVNQTKSSVNYKLVHDTRHTTCDSNVAYIQLLEYAIPPPRALFWIWWQFCLDFSRFFLLICLKFFWFVDNFVKFVHNFVCISQENLLDFLKKKYFSVIFWNKVKQARRAKSRQLEVRGGPNGPLDFYISYIMEGILAVKLETPIQSCFLIFIHHFQNKLSDLFDGSLLWIVCIVLNWKRALVPRAGPDLFEEIADF